MTISPHTTVGELAGRFPATVKVFQRHHIEFCCGGGRTLGRVCRDARLSYVTLTAELADAVAHAPSHAGWSDRPLAELIAHIVEAFHDVVRQELPRLRQLATKLQGHGDDQRRVLTVIHYELARFGVEVAVQMDVEERHVFPLIAQAEAGTLTGPARERIETLRREAEAFHQDSAQTLRMLRQITNGYIAPPTACSALRALYLGLQELEALMQLHVHLEINVLFSRVAALTSGAGVEKHR